MPALQVVSLEKDVERALVAGVKARGGMAEKVVALGRRGFFDRLVVLPGGRIFFCEIKRPRGGIVSPHQARRISDYAALGAQVRLLKNIADVEAFLAEI